MPPTPDSTLSPHLPRAASLRQTLHSIPEIGYHEHKTAALIREELSRLNIPHTPGVPHAPTATIALLGNPQNPCIALRADIDALPIHEKTNLPYQSTHPGQMHACGHDGHTAILLTLAAILKQQIDANPDYPLSIKLLFQPAEENGAGAAKLIAAGALDGTLGPKPQAIFALHGWPGLPLGTIASKPGPLMASTENFSVSFLGQGSHGAFPHLAHDPILAAASAILDLQQVVSREFDPTEPCVVTIGILHAGTAVNIIPDQSHLAGTVRTLTDQARHQAHNAVDRRLHAIAQLHQCQLKIDWSDGYPPLINHPQMTTLLAKSVSQSLGPDHYLPISRPCMGAEDFAFYLNQIPGAFFFLGLTPDNEPHPAPLHTDTFNFNDHAIPTALKTYLAILNHFATRTL